MKSRLILLLLFLSFAVHAQVPGINYYASTGKGHCRVRINTDNRTYEQQVFDCTYNFTTEGTFIKSADTLILKPLKTYYISANTGKKKLMTDSTSTSVLKSKRMTKYLVKNDTLIQLVDFKNAYHPTWELTKQESRKR